MSAQRIVHRMGSDGLHRERWEFNHNGHSLTLEGYGIERRKTARGRFSGWLHKERWLSMDERRYNSGVERPTSIPSDVIREAAAFTLRVNIGWTNEASKYCDVPLAPGMDIKGDE